MSPYPQHNSPITKQHSGSIENFIFPHEENTESEPWWRPSDTRRSSWSRNDAQPCWCVILPSETPVQRNRQNCRRKQRKNITNGEWPGPYLKKTVFHSFGTEIHFQNFYNKLPYDFLTVPDLMRKKNCKNFPSLRKVNLGTLDKKEVFCVDQKTSQLNRNFVSGWEEKRSDMTFQYD